MDQDSSDSLIPYDEIVQEALRAVVGRVLGEVEAGGEARDAQDAHRILGEGREVFDLSKEKPELRDRYGRHTFGQDCLAARRMVEAGVPYIVINYPGGWDTHSNHFATMRRQCPQLDQGVAMLSSWPLALFYVVLGFPVSYVLDRHNRTKIVAVCIAMWSAATVMCGVASSRRPWFTRCVI